MLHTRGAVPTSAHASASYSSIPTASMHTWTFPHAVWDTRRHREGTGPWCSTTAEGGLVLFLITASKFWWSELSVPVCIPTSKPCVHNSQHWKFALLNQGSSYDIKVCIVDYKIGAKVITNVDASNDPNFSPEVHFIAKKVLQTYTFGMFAKLVMSSGHGIFPIFCGG